MKKIVLGMIAVVMTFSSIAQSNKSNENKEFQKRGKRHEKTEKFEKLNLSTAQKEQMKSLNESFRQQMQDLKNSNLSNDQLKSRRMELAKEHRERMSAILTPEQRQQAKEYKKEWKEDRKEYKKSDKKDGVRSNKFDKMNENRFKQLNLTPAQSNQVAALNQDLKKDIQNIRENNALNQDEKKFQMKSLMQNHKSAMKNLLTDDQKNQLKNHNKNRPKRNAVK